MKEIFNSSYTPEWCYVKEPHAWTLYVATALCLLSVAAYLFLTTYCMILFFLAFFVSKAVFDILLSKMTLIDYRRDFLLNVDKKVIQYPTYISGLIDLLACGAIVFSMVTTIYPMSLDFILLRWLVLQAVWTAFFTQSEELKQQEGILNVLSVFQLAVALIVLIWARNSFTLIAALLLMYFVLRLLIAICFRKQTLKKHKSSI